MNLALPSLFVGKPDPDLLHDIWKYVQPHVWEIGKWPLVVLGYLAVAIIVARLLFKKRGRWGD